MPPPPQQSPVTSLQPPLYHLWPLTYYSISAHSMSTTTPAPLQPLSIIMMSDNMMLAQQPFRYLCYVLQWIRGSLQHHGRQRHGLFVPISSSLMTSLPTAMKLPNRHHHVLILDDGCLYEDDYVTLSKRASNSLHSMKTCLHHQ